MLLAVSSLHTLLCAGNGARLLPSCRWSGLWPLCFHADAAVRWHAASAATVLLPLPPTSRTALFQRLQLDPLLPSALATQSLAGPSSPSPTPLLSSPSHYAPLPDRLVNVQGLLLRRRRPLPDGPLSSLSPLISTPSTDAGLASLSLALLGGGPILVHGPAGSGKSALLREMARLTGNVDLVEIHLDDQVRPTNTDSMGAGRIGGHRPHIILSIYEWHPVSMCT